MLDKIKHYLKKSGIIVTNESGQWEELHDSINPFDEIIEHSEYPLARIYRQEFFDGIIDTYDVFMGEHYNLKKGRKGILDLLIFPLFARLLIIEALNTRQYKLIRIIAAIIGAPLEIARGVLGVALTLVVSPLVAVVHFLAFFKAQSYKKEIESLCFDVSLGLGNDKKVVGKSPIPQCVSGMNPYSIITIHPGFKPVTTNSEYKADEEPSPPAQKLAFLYSDLFFKKYSLDLKLTNRKAILAFLALNTGHILDELKKNPGAFQEIHQWLKQTPEQACREAFVLGTLEPRSGESASAVKSFFENAAFEPKLLKKIFHMAQIGSEVQANTKSHIPGL
ncbi:MAG: hypothetical protein H0U75_02410 [Legionella sp.]|nr:hypothetical protein [Legionella sp.]